MRKYGCGFGESAEWCVIGAVIVLSLDTRVKNSFELGFVLGIPVIIIIYNSGSGSMMF